MNKETEKAAMKSNPKVLNVAMDFYTSHDIEVISDAHRFSKEVQFLIVREQSNESPYEDNGVDLTGDEFPKYFSKWMQRTFNRQILNESEMPLFIKCLSKLICDDVELLCSNTAKRCAKSISDSEIQDDRRK